MLHCENAVPGPGTMPPKLRRSLPQSRGVRQTPSAPARGYAESDVRTSLPGRQVRTNRSSRSERGGGAQDRLESGRKRVPPLASLRRESPVPDVVQPIESTARRSPRRMPLRCPAGSCLLRFERMPPITDPSTNPALTATLIRPNTEGRSSCDVASAIYACATTTFAAPTPAKIRAASSHQRLLANA